VTGTAAGPELPASRTQQLPVAGIAAAAVLAAGLVFWAAFPLTGRFVGLVLVVAIVAGIMSIAELAAKVVAPRQTDLVPGASAMDRLVQQLLGVVLALPWAELMTVAVVVLEALHRSQPWHTAVLGIALTGYLLAVHSAETRAGARVLRGQLPLLGIGAGLIALSVGAAALPGIPAGPVASLVRIAVAVVAVVAVGLAIPVWLSREHRS
jgi:hypothetical protein